MAKKKRGGVASGSVVLGFVLGAFVAVGTGFAYLHLVKPRQESTDRSTRQMKPVAGAAVHGQRVNSKDVIAAPTMRPPFGASEDVFEGGAEVYRARCAQCHGLPGQNAAAGSKMHPAAAQLWRTNLKGAGTGKGRADPADIYRKVAYGVPQSGMPGYRQELSETEMWQVSLLLANAGREMPDPVWRILANR